MTSCAGDRRAHAGQEEGRHPCPGWVDSFRRGGAHHRPTRFRLGSRGPYRPGERLILSPISSHPPRSLKSDERITSSRPIFEHPEPVPKGAGP